MLNQIVQALMLGGFYALVACGLSFMFSVLKIINLAHGSLAILAAYVLWYLAKTYGINPFVGLAITVPVFFILGVLIQRWVLDRALKGGALMCVLATFGLSVVLDNMMFEVVGANTRSLAPYIGELSWDAWRLPGDIYLGKLPALTFVVAVLLLGGLAIFLKATAVGRAIRATAFDDDTAALVGIDARRTSAIAAGIAVSTIAIAGAFLGMRGIFDAYTGASLLLFAFEATVIGGIGSLWGTLIGGIVLAMAQTLGAQVHPQGFLISGHLTFLLVLMFRLRGTALWHRWALKRFVASRAQVNS